MQFFIMSIVLFLVFVLYFRYLFKLCFSFDKKIILLLACLCSIPCLKPNSILFIFEVHFILISFLMTKIMKYIIKKQDKIKLRLLYFRFYFNLWLYEYKRYQKNRIYNLH